MNEAELKLSIFRAIDQLTGDSLYRLYRIVLDILEKDEQRMEDSLDSKALELGYAAMSEDITREQEAQEWIEGVLNKEEL